MKKLVLIPVLLIAIIFISGCVSGTNTPTGDVIKEKVYVCPDGSEVSDSSLCSEEKCTPNWQCDEWSKCDIYGKQTRTCKDENACGLEKGRPAEEQECEIPKIVELRQSSYTANGLMFDVDIAERGLSVSYIDGYGNTNRISAQDGKELIKFKITVTSVDGEKSFYYSNFNLMDEEGYTYEPQCPVDFYGNCKNRDSISSMYDPIEGQKVSGNLLFQIPLSTNTVYLVYKFSSSYDRPQVLKFVFD